MIDIEVARLLINIFAFFMAIAFGLVGITNLIIYVTGGESQEYLDSDKSGF